MEESNALEESNAHAVLLQISIPWKKKIVKIIVKIIQNMLPQLLTYHILVMYHF